jgi:hypothetical protein
MIRGLSYVLRRVVCWAQGHNLVGIDLPPGWSEQRCKTCGQLVGAWKR